MIFMAITTNNSKFFSAFVGSAWANEQKIESIKETSIQNDNYIIGPGDILDLQIYDAPEFTGSYKVLNDGSVPFPLIGGVNLNYLTLEEASALIQLKYSKEFLRPELHLSIKEARPIKISIIGEIERPGLYSLTVQEKSQIQGGPQLTNSGLPTMVDAIQKAGGVTQNANLEEVIISRRLSGGPHKYKKASFNLLKLLMNGNHAQNPFLFDGDIIKLTKADKMPAEVMEIAQANLSPRTINVSVIGQVSNPGTIEVASSTPLFQAILIAGGPIDWKANINNIELIRINRNGSTTRKNFKIDLSKGVSKEANPPLIDRDIINVKSTNFNKMSTGLRALADPFSSIITSYSLWKLID